MNDIGPPVGLQVNPLGREAEGRGGEFSTGNKILTSTPDHTDGRLNVI